jgi:hypothetical protein
MAGKGSSFSVRATSCELSCLICPVYFLAYTALLLWHKHAVNPVCVYKVGLQKAALFDSAALFDNYGVIFLP